MTTAEVIDALNEACFGLDFSVAKSLRYHAYRRSFWSGWERLNKILAVFSGAAVLVSWLSDHPNLAGIFAAIVASVSMLDLVLDFGGNARQHDTLYRQFSSLAQRLATMQDEPTEKALSEIRRDRLAIEMEEPAVIDWLERRCAAEEALARGCEVNPAWKLPRWKMMLAQVALWPSLPRLK